MKNQINTYMAKDGTYTVRQAGCIVEAGMGFLQAAALCDRLREMGKGDASGIDWRI